MRPGLAIARCGDDDRRAPPGSFTAGAAASIGRNRVPPSRRVGIRRVPPEARPDVNSIGSSLACRPGRARAWESNRPSRRRGCSHAPRRSHAGHPIMQPPPDSLATLRYSAARHRARSARCLHVGPQYAGEERTPRRMRDMLEPRAASRWGQTLSRGESPTSGLEGRVVQGSRREWPLSSSTDERPLVSSWRAVSARCSPVS
jgi:hypothetical protein